MLTDVSANMNASFTSQTVNVQNTDKASIHVKWSVAGPEGAFTLEARQGDESTDWFELSFGSAITILNTETEIQLMLTEIAFREIRLKWAPTNSVSATAQAIITLKTVGA